MTATLESAMTHELLDIIDLNPVPGEYAGCRGPLETFDVFGIQAQGFFLYHAQRSAVSKRWDGQCECCGHRLRYAHITQDGSGEFHCFGGKCLANVTLGTEGANKLEYSQRIEQKKAGGFCATFNVPGQFWDMPREKRPQFARPWKGKAFTRSGRMTDRVQWKLSVWGVSFEECLENCVELGRQLGVKLS